MNYLAHLFLSGSNPAIIVGNFIGDSVRGSQLDHFSEGIQKGIQLHRAIDTFTDQHPLVHEAKSFFVPVFDKYSGVLIDIFFDHVLAKNFSNYSLLSLNDYSQKILRVLSENKKDLPEAALGFYKYMVANDVPQCYANLKGIQMVLGGMTYRIKNRFNLVDAIEIFNANAIYIEELFTTYFPLLQKFSIEFRNDEESY